MDLTTDIVFGEMCIRDSIRSMTCGRLAKEMLMYVK